MVNSAVLALVAGVLISGIVLSAPPEAHAQDPAQEIEIDMDEGWRYYQRYCQNCHGEKGEGDGRIAHMLKEQPSNLTLLSEGNDGVFPQDLVSRAIDGRQDDIHSRREMPIWGQVFGESEEIEGDQEAVHLKILELTAIVRSLDRSVREAATP